MPIKAVCPNCDTAYALPEEKLGKSVRCRECEKTFVVEEQGADERVRSVPEEVRASRAAAAGKKRRPRDEDEEDDRPRQRGRDEEDEEDEGAGRKKKRSILPMLLLGGGALLFLGCGGAGALGYYVYTKATEKATATVASYTPPPGDPFADTFKEQPKKEEPKKEETKKEEPEPVKPKEPEPVKPKEPEPVKPKEPEPVKPKEPEPTTPRDLDEALAWLEESKMERQKAALTWLSTAPVAEARRSEVAKALDPLLEDAEVRKPALPALRPWATKDNVPTLLKLVEDTSPLVWRPSMEILGKIQDERAAEPLAKQLLDNFRNGTAESALRDLGRTAGEKEVLKYLYHKNATARNAAGRLARNYAIPDGALVDQAVKALVDADADTRRFAAEDLSRRKLVADKQADVSSALDKVVLDPDQATRRAGMQAMNTWGGPDNVKGIVEAMVKYRETRGQGIPLLGKFKGPLAITALIELLGAGLGERRAASQALKQVGKEAEPILLKTMPKVRDKAMLREMIGILGTVGTKASLPRLNTIRLGYFKTDRNLSNDAQNAIAAISTRP